MNEDDQMVVKALHVAGMRVDSVYDLVNTRERYPQAIPVLIAMLPQVRHDRIKEELDRALTTKQARPVAAKPLIRAFRDQPTTTPSQRETKWAMGNAISIVADDSVYNEISALLADKQHGDERAEIVLALCNMRTHSENAVQQLIDFLSDPELGVNAVIALGNLRVKRARLGIERYLKHADPWVRDKARRALAKIDKIGKN